MPNDHYTHENATAPGIALAHTVYGEPVTASLRTEQSNAGTVRQVQSVFTDYKPPKRRLNDNPDKELCAHEGCNAFPMSNKNYCPGHARVHGEVKTCRKDGCKAPPKNGQDTCRWHETKVSDEPDPTD